MRATLSPRASAVSLNLLLSTSGDPYRRIRDHLGLSGKPDWALAERIAKDEFTFVTNNRVDFIQIFGRMELHTGLIVIVPNVVPALQRALFEAAIQYLAGRDLINTVIEVTLHGKAVTCVEYQLPTE